MVKRFHLNWVDIVIIVVVLALAAAAILVRNLITGADQKQTYTMRFSAEAQSIEREVAESFRIGDEIYNSSTDEYIGKVVGIDIKPHRHLSYSESAGKYTDCDNPIYVDLVLEIEGKGYVDELIIHMEKKELRIGSIAYLKAKGHAVSTYIIAIDTMDAPIPEYTGKPSGDKEITYQTRIFDVRKMTVDSFKKGEPLIDVKTGAILGIIQDVSYEQYVECWPHQGEVILVEKPDRYTVTLTLKGSCVETDTDYFLDGIAEFKIGANPSDGVVGRYQQTSMEYIKILKVE